MAYRASEEHHSISPPSVNKRWWFVYQKSNHKNHTKVFERHWIDAKREGATKLGITSLDDCEAKRYEKM